MRTVYLDESEQSAAGIFAVAGYVFDPRSVRDFDRRWREILGMWKVPEFHMKEFAHGQNAFAGWSDGSRQAFLDRLIQTIHDHVQFHVMVSVDTNALSRLTPNEKAEMLDLSKYAIAAVFFLSEIQRVTKYSEDLLCIYDEVRPKFGRDRLEKEFKSQLRKGGMGRGSRVIWARSIEYPGLQAADFLAYEYARELARWRASPEYRPRMSGRRLIFGIGPERHHEAFIDAEAIQNMLNAFRIHGGLEAFAPKRRNRPAAP